MEHWHPNPDFFFKPGGGPVLDLGPYYIAALLNLIGPVKRVCAMSAMPFKTRTIGSGTRNGEKIDVSTPTTIHAILEFRSGAKVTLTASWDVWAHRHQPMELYGTRGTLFLADPNYFGGDEAWSPKMERQKHWTMRCTRSVWRMSTTTACRVRTTALPAWQTCPVDPEWRRHRVPLFARTGTACGRCHGVDFEIADRRERSSKSNTRPAVHRRLLPLRQSNCSSEAGCRCTASHLSSPQGMSGSEGSRPLAGKRGRAGMALLIAGLVLFLGIHTLPSTGACCR